MTSLLCPIAAFGMTCLALLATPLQAGTSADELAEGAAVLEAYLSDLSTVRARFVQSLYDADGQLLSESSGEMWLRRPGRFRWEYRDPFPQLMVADGEKLWIHDPDLEQVTVRSLATTVADTPASLLISDEDYRDDFVITNTQPGPEPGVLAIRLEPQGAGTGDFEYLALRFREGELERMEAVDRLDQLTRIDFSQVKRGGRLPAKRFRFKLPEGVDVIDQSDDADS
ncbi:MAG: outer membrane lipoprotein chaperone LolA [Pseudomonadota bacterium]